MRFETETFAVYRDGGEDRVSFHSLKGHRNAIVLSLENITGETIRDNCVLVTLRFAVVTEWRLCVNSSGDGPTLYGQSKSCPANRLRNGRARAKNGLYMHVYILERAQVF